MTLKRALKIFALSAITGMVAACSGADAPPKPPAPQVGFVAVSVSDVPVPTTLAGRTVAFETSEVRPQITGYIRKRLFTEGQMVRAGQPLYEVDPSLYQAAFNQAKANLASARASAEAAVARAERFRPLAEMEAVAQQDYTDAAAQARMAQAAVAQNEAMLETARVNLRFTTIPAPISGRIGRSLLTVGALASANQADPMAIIQRIDPIFVDIQQSSADMIGLRQSIAAGSLQQASARVRLQLEDGSAYPIEGEVQFSEVVVNPSTGTVTLRARFPNPQGLLLPGMFVRAIFNTAIRPGALLVPQPAVLRDFDGSPYIFVVGKDDKAERRKITTDQTSGTNWVVTSGLKAGERVITQGLANIKHGDAIRPVAASSPQPIGQPAGGAAPPAGARPRG